VSPPNPNTLFRMFDRGKSSVMAAFVFGLGVGYVMGKGDKRAAESFWKERAARSHHDDRRPDREHEHANHWHGNHNDRFHLLCAGVQRTSCRSQAFLGIIRREPALRPHADQDVLALRPTCLLDEAIALLRAEVAMSQGAKVTLHVDGLDSRDGSLDTDIPIRWGLRLCAETEPPRLREQAPFP
jgi:hypothetical protein